MEYSELIGARYSVRAYRPDRVEEEKLQCILDAARWANHAGVTISRERSVSRHNAKSLISIL